METIKESIHRNTLNRIKASLRAKTDEEAIKLADDLQRDFRVNGKHGHLVRLYMAAFPERIGV